MKIVANVVGLAAVALFVLSYQLKTRRGIIFFNAASRVLYIAQYILLGAFEGALLDLAGFVVSVLAQHINTGWLQKHRKLTIAAANVFIVAVGMSCCQNVFSLLPVVGVLFETGAFWLNTERQIRFVSFFAAPFWLAYNLVCCAYGSAIGNVMTMVSIGIAITRYDILKSKHISQCHMK